MGGITGVPRPDFVRGLHRADFILTNTPPDIAADSSAAHPAPADAADASAAPSPSNPSHGKAWALAVVLTLAALMLTGYLTFAVLPGDGRPMGCGGTTETTPGSLFNPGSEKSLDSGGAGCGAVLGTKWSKVLGLPVSALAVVLYVVVLATLLTRKKMGGFVLAASATAILGAGLWFTYLQLVEVQAICKYCMTDHAIGAVLTVVLLSATQAKHLRAGVLVGVVGVAGLAVTQWFSPNLIASEQVAAGQQAGEVLTLLDGNLVIDLGRTPIIGQADSPRRVVVMVDYACPHCRKAHGLLLDAGNVAVVVLPMPLNAKCNPHAPESMPARFDESCALAATVLEVWAQTPARFAEFDRWMFAPETPRSAAQAAAQQLVYLNNNDLNDTDAARSADAETLAAKAFADGQLARNIAAFGYLKQQDLADRLPILINPDTGVLLYGKLHGPEDLAALFTPAAPPPHEPAHE